MKYLKSTLFTLVMALSFGMVFSSTVAASCSVTCAAICRWTCEFEVFGSCSDAERDAKIQACCTGAFANTPGIEDVPCTVGGGEN